MGTRSLENIDAKRQNTTHNNDGYPCVNSEYERSGRRERINTNFSAMCLLRPCAMRPAHLLRLCAQCAPAQA